MVAACQPQRSFGQLMMIAPIKQHSTASVNRLTTSHADMSQIPARGRQILLRLGRSAPECATHSANNSHTHTEQEQGRTGFGEWVNWSSLKSSPSGRTAREGEQRDHCCFHKLPPKEHVRDQLGRPQGKRLVCSHIGRLSGCTEVGGYGKRQPF